MPTANRVQEFRRSRGLGAAELAKQAGVSRQTIYAIEAGSFVPNTTVALRLARVLEARVEDLFSVSDGPETPLPAELLAGNREPRAAGRTVRLCRVGKRLMAIPAEAIPQYLPSADGAVAGSASTHLSIQPTAQLPEDGKRILIAGCDPALSFLEPELRRSGVEAVFAPGSSRQALDWLKRGKVHVAGSHLLDRKSGAHNVPLIRKLFPGSRVRLFTFASWEAGLVVRKGNPKAIRSIADLGRKDVTMVNRETGAGSRDLLDRGLAAAGVESKRVRGYTSIASGHLSAAWEVASGQADCCIASLPAALAFGLDFVPLAAQRFDLAIATPWADAPAVKALLDALNRSTLRRALRDLAGYDTGQTGTRWI